MKRATIDRYLDLLERSGGVGRLMDFGCGAGFLVERAIERGWDACGVDVSHVAVAEARRLVGMERIMLGKVEEVTLPQIHFDAITMFDFLEHVCEPKSTLLCAHSLLRRGGLLLIITPLAGGLSHLLMGRRWSQFKAEHLQYFSRRSLTWALQHTGFEIARLGIAWKYLTLDYICRHMGSYPHPLLTPVAKSLWRAAGAWFRYRLLVVPAGDMLALARRL